MTHKGVCSSYNFMKGRDAMCDIGQVHVQVTVHVCAHISQTWTAEGHSMTPSYCSH